MGDQYVFETVIRKTQARHLLVRGLLSSVALSFLRLLLFAVWPLLNSHPNLRNVIIRRNVSLEQFLRQSYHAVAVRFVSACFAVWVSASMVVGCSSSPLSSKWAMADPDYAEKYSQPYGRDKNQRMLKQSVDARFVDNKRGWFAGGAGSSSPGTGGVEIGGFTYLAPWLEGKLGLAGLIGTGAEDGFLGMNGNCAFNRPPDWLRLSASARLSEATCIRCRLATTDSTTTMTCPSTKLARPNQKSPSSMRSIRKLACTIGLPEARDSLAVRATSSRPTVETVTSGSRGSAFRC